MKWYQVLPAVACIADNAYAFPSYLQGAVDHVTAARLSSVVDEAVRSAHEKRASLDTVNQPIDVTGKHEFQPPNFDKGDQRGSCPGLNALANHGYIQRSGVTSLVEIVGATNEVFGMGIDVATVLGTLGTVYVGNPLSLKPGFSIGGAPKGSDNILGNLAGLLGKPRGLDASHNVIEGDGSNTRNDLYVTGDPSTMDLDLFQSFYDMASEDGTYDFDTFTERAKNRFHESIATNPQFYYGPLTGMVIRNAAYFFTSRMMSNHTKGSDEDIMGMFTTLIQKRTILTMYRSRDIENLLRCQGGRWKAHLQARMGEDSQQLVPSIRRLRLRVSDRGRCQTDYRLPRALKVSLLLVPQKNMY